MSKLQIAVVGVILVWLLSVSAAQEKCRTIVFEVYRSVLVKGIWEIPL